MTDQCESRATEAWVTKAPSAIHELLFVVEGKPLPDGQTLEPWKENAIKTIINGSFPNLETPFRLREYPPAMYGKMLGSLVVLLPVLKREGNETANISAREIISGLSALVTDKFATIMGAAAQQATNYKNLLSLLPSLRTLREFSAGLADGLNSIYDSDGITLKKESELLILCYLFWAHSDLLRPISGMTLTHVHKWVNEKTAAPISLANVRKVAGNIGLKLAEPGHP